MLKNICEYIILLKFFRITPFIDVSECCYANNEAKGIRMSKFSIRKLNKNVETNIKPEFKDELSRAKAEYQKFAEKMKNSDFANSPVALREELDLLEELEFEAEDAGKLSELDWIKAKIKEVHSKLESAEQKEKAVPDIPYYKPIIEPYSELKSVRIPDNESVYSDYKSALREFMNEDGTFVPNAGDIVNVLRQRNATPYQTQIILSRCKNNDNSLSSDMLKGINQLLENDFSPVYIPEFIEDFSDFDSVTGQKYISESAIEDMQKMRSAGVNDSSVIKFLKFVNDGYEDKNSIITSLSKLYKANIKDDDVINILNQLSVRSLQETKVVNQDAVNSIALLKNAFVRTQKNETEERTSPIGQLGENVLEDDIQLIFTKDGQYKYSYFKKDNPPELVKERYFEAVADSENSFLSDFVKKYRKEDGSLDTNALRTVVQLRNVGVTLPNLLSLTDRCLSGEEINSDMVSGISKFKKAGALSEDIEILLDSAVKTETGILDEKSVSDICDLTKAVINGRNVSELLPKIIDNQAAKDSVINLANILENKSYLKSLTDLCLTPNGSIDVNSMETLYYLLADRLDNFNDKVYEHEIIGIAKEVLELAQSPDTKEMSDDATGIVSVMTNNGADFTEIKEAITLCKNENGIVDEKLAQILWDLGIQKADLSEMKSFIGICKNDNGNVNSDKADMIIFLFASGFPKDKIASLLIH